MFWNSICHSFKRFRDIDGETYAGSIAYFGFFSLFPLIILFVSVISVFINKDQAGKAVIAFSETYFPITGEMQQFVFDILIGIINGRGKASVFAGLMLIWTILQFIITVISITNRAWGIKFKCWWRLPLKSFIFLFLILGVGLVISALPEIERIMIHWIPSNNYLRLSNFSFLSPYFSFFVIFIYLSLFYRLAPQRPTFFKDVWPVALCMTFFLKMAELMFEFYLKNIATLNLIYGAIGGIAALLLWFYISGCLYIFGACLCATLVERKKRTSKRIHTF